MLTELDIKVNHHDKIEHDQISKVPEQLGFIGLRRYQQVNFLSRISVAETVKEENPLNSTKNPSWCSVIANLSSYTVKVSMHILI